MSRLRFLYPVALAFVTSASAQTMSPAPAPPADQLQSANALFMQRNWSGALDAYAVLAKAYPTHALSRFRLGVSLLELNRYAEAETSLKEGERLGTPAGQAAFRLAQVAAERGQSDEAIRELLRSARARLFLAPSAVDTTKHLGALRTHPKWNEVLDAFDVYVRPCLHDARYREFDFWIGDWDVRSAGAPPTSPAARNTITADEDGCVITEHWRPGGAFQGRSFNMFDRSYGVWRQTWVDNTGAQHDYRGNLNKEGNLVYMAELPNPPGVPGRRTTRLTFFNISRDSVRQFNEFTLDSGKTWQVGYDLYYVRRAVSATEASPPSLVANALSAADRQEIAALGDSFVRGWLRDDTTAVLNLFLTSAVLRPPGSAQVTGRDSIRAYWWPRDGSKTRVTGFERTVEGVTGNNEVAIVQAKVALTWTSTKDGKTTTQTSRSVEMQTLARDPLGKWRIARHAWR